MKKLLVALLALAATAFSQDLGLPVSDSEGPAPSAYHTVYGYAAGGTLAYICWSMANISTGNRYLTTYNISAATNANPAVFTTTASFDVNTRPIVTIKGATGMWTPVNGTFTATIVDSTHFSIPVNSTSFGALTGTLTYQSTSVALNQPFWAVEMFTYNAAMVPAVISREWLAGTNGFSNKCSDATTTTLNVQ